ncbi:MAG: hypothetical protein AAF938_06655 [Myxococcota bacterium]
MRRLLIGGSLIAMGLAIYGFALAFLHQAVCTEGEVADLDCYTSEKGNRVCAAVLGAHVDGEAVCRTELSASTGPSPRLSRWPVCYVPADPAGTLRRGHPAGLAIGLLLLFLGMTFLLISDRLFRRRVRNSGASLIAAAVATLAAVFVVISTAVNDGSIVRISFSLGLAALWLWSARVPELKLFHRSAPLIVLGAVAVLAIGHDASFGELAHWQLSAVVAVCAPASFYARQWLEAARRRNARRAQQLLQSRVDAAKGGQSDERLVHVLHVGERCVVRAFGYEEECELVLREEGALAAGVDYLLTDAAMEVATGYRGEGGQRIRATLALSLASLAKSPPSPVLPNMSVFAVFALIFAAMAALQPPTPPHTDGPSPWRATECTADSS